MDGSVPSTAVAAPPPTKEEIRARIFSGVNKKQKSKVIEFLGSRIEIRQPLLSDIVNQSGEDKVSDIAVIQTLVAYAYMPGTETKLFDAADEESFLAMPFGKDFKIVQETLEELTSISFAVGKPG